MSNSTHIGRCPNCTTAIPEKRMLIRYENANDVRVFAECPDCNDVVFPRG